MKIAKASEMQQLDRRAIEHYGIAGIVLMENAGRGTVSIMEETFGPLTGSTVVIFVGPGNNGGDGLVIARHLLTAGARPLVVFTIPPEKLRGDAAANGAIVEKLQIPSLVLSDPFDKEDIYQTLIRDHMRNPVSCIVDALFGTGLSREVTGHMGRIVEIINDLRTSYHLPVVAVDLPSGLDTDTGLPLGKSVIADLTVTYGLAKPAHYLHGGQGIGKLHVVDITIPRQAYQEIPLRGQAITREITNSLPARATDSHKGTHGHLLVLAGSEGKTGAAILCCRAALTSGCGLVTSVVPKNLNPVMEASLIEAMTLVLPDAASTSLSIDDVDYILAAAIGKKAIVLGPGIGTDEQTEELVLLLYREVPLPMVVDADALTILGLHRDVLVQPGGPRILTPHPGEMARLTGLATNEIQANRLQAALSFCLKHEEEQKQAQKIVTVLKGAGTVVADNQGKWAINTSGNQGMATGGMGDVLAGLIGSLLAQGMDAWDAACAGVYLHGLAADLIATQKEYGYTASEVAAELPVAIQKCRNFMGETR